MVEDENRLAGLEEFTEIPVPLPPILMSMIGYYPNARFVGLYYYGNKATWYDGLSLATFSYYRVWEPLKTHPVMDVHLLDVHLGSDDLYPTHALLCDREERKFYVGEYEKVKLFLHRQHPVELTEEYLAEYRGEIEREQPRTDSDFHRRGLFEFITVPDESAERETHLLRQWLDSYITEALVEQLVEMLNKKDYRVWPSLDYIKRLCQTVTASEVPVGE